MVEGVSKIGGTEECKCVSRGGRALVVKTICLVLVPLGGSISENVFVAKKHIRQPDQSLTAL